MAMLKTITIDTDTQMVVPRELLKKARLCIEDYIEGAPADGTDEKCMDDISSILAIKQPEQAQQSLCEDCPPPDYPANKTRCLPCPRRQSERSDSFAKAEAIVRTWPQWKQDYKLTKHSKSGTQSKSVEFDAEFLSKRLGRVAKLVGYEMPEGSHTFIANVAGTILGAIAGILERQQATPRPIPTSERLLSSAIALRDDLLLRAEMAEDGCRVVFAGASVWDEFKEAIEVTSLQRPESPK
jgi:hypothetical protein